MYEIGYTTGTFDLVHQGHFEILKKCNLYCKKLIVVTGKGLHSTHESDPYISKDLGILKHSVPNFIRNNKNLMRKIIEIKGADIKDGGDGAIYIILKKNNK